MTVVDRSYHKDTHEDGEDWSHLPLGKSREGKEKVGATLGEDITTMLPVLQQWKSDEVNGNEGSSA